VRHALDRLVADPPAGDIITRAPQPQLRRYRRAAPALVERPSGSPVDWCIDGAALAGQAVVLRARARVRPMSGYEAIRLDDIPRGYDRGPEVAELKPVRHHLGITAFGANARVAHKAGQVLVVPHDERPDGPYGTEGHEELYLVLRGHAIFNVDGSELDAPAGTLVFVRDPALVRRAIARDPDTAIIGIGAPPGRPFRPAPWEARAVDPDGAA
jgi:hypothetical protein